MQAQAINVKYFTRYMLPNVAWLQSRIYFGYLNYHKMSATTYQ